MDTKNLSVPSHAQSRTPGKNHPHGRPSSGVSGVVHDNARHTTRFTVIGNHLAQHPELSLLAIGLGTHIQSLPAGALVDIKTLARKFPESPARIAAALRELETHGYLRRTRERTPGGNIVTRTVSCNQPGRRSEGHAERLVEPEPNPGRPTHHAPAPEQRASELTRPAHPAAPAPPKKRTPRKPLPAVPQPAYSGCDRAFRSPEPGRCRDCRSDLLEAA
ncbi:helix-turn-helix domain-containing protein [Streptomyces sp. SID12488]|uniref:helix-turn-helix domain-containing protein n=1 Tax=Streptomyces sp. SID12488 TaxID=2706040 RepID=UPI0013D9DBB6|nr:helix-turn-helix domain-containing protein [Streptomyces sp. SID12488]NEA67822.1 helix-turn-helix domain-containing protein [Streptomyces sp. SID12488]